MKTTKELQQAAHDELAAFCRAYDEALDVDDEVFEADRVVTPELPGTVVYTFPSAFDDPQDLHRALVCSIGSFGLYREVAPDYTCGDHESYGGYDFWILPNGNALAVFTSPISELPVILEF